MSILLETTLGDVVVDLDIDGSPELCKNVLKLAKARYYTSTLVYNVQPGRFCQLGDPRGDGTGGGCIYGVIETSSSSNPPASNDNGQSENKKRDKEQLHLQQQHLQLMKSRHRFLKSDMGRPLSKEECQEKGRVVATEMNGIKDTIGSQLLITTSSGVDRALDGYQPLSSDGTIAAASGQQQHQDDHSTKYRSVGRVVEDPNNVLDQIDASYCDANGRPYADIRVIRALVVVDPFDDPPGMHELLKIRGVVVDDSHKKLTGNEEENGTTEGEDHLFHVVSSPDYERPEEEVVERRIQADQIDQDTEADAEKLRQREEEMLQREDKSRAVVLEMLGDLPSADIKAPENVLFVCKLNSVTEDEDLELIFSRFDENVKAEIIRDTDTGASLQYAFVEFTSKDKAVEAYFKMNNALVDDRRIKVDFSQSVAKVWDRYRQKQRNKNSNVGAMPRDPYAASSNANNKQRQHLPPFRDGTSSYRPNHHRRDDGGSYNRRRNDDGGGRGDHQRQGINGDRGHSGGRGSRSNDRYPAPERRYHERTNHDRLPPSHHVERNHRGDSRERNRRRSDDDYDRADDRRRHEHLRRDSSDSDRSRVRKKRRRRSDHSRSPDSRSSEDGDRRRSKKHKKDKKKKKKKHRHRHRRDEKDYGSGSEDSSDDEIRRRHRHKHKHHNDDDNDYDADRREKDRRHSSSASKERRRHH